MCLIGTDKWKVFVWMNFILKVSVRMVPARFSVEVEHNPCTIGNPLESYQRHFNSCDGMMLNSRKLALLKVIYL